MAKTNYFITGIWETTYNNSKFISHVLLHKNTDAGFERGVKTSREDVVKLIDGKHNVMTLRWDYNTASYKSGAYVEVIEISSIRYLRTHKDATVNDNLDNMIKMDWLI